MAAKLRRWRLSTADGGQAPSMAAELCRWRQSSALPMAASPQQWEIKSNLIKLLKEKCGEEMKSGTNSGNPDPALAGHNDGGANHEQKSDRTAEKTHKSNAECFLRHFRSVPQQASNRSHKIEVFHRLDCFYAWNPDDQA
jgi:hypothetical protein